MKISAANLISGNSKLRSKSVKTPSAQESQVLQSGYELDSGFSSKVYYILNDKRTPWLVRLVVELQYLYGLRISSALHVRFCDITSNGGIYIRQGKGSESLIVYSRIFPERLMRIKSESREFILNFSRYYFYRYYKKVGLYSEFSGNTNKSVTHLFRHNIALSLKEDMISKQDVKRFLGHRNIKSTGSYYDKERK